ncbi:replication protein [Symbiopectobacterium purcellii]|uniref:replication protein n=1 Tax=Symbiopectobacterium purcellii TaxID=2871826 RepID=UPI003F835515
MNTAEIYQFPDPEQGQQEHRVADTDDGFIMLAMELYEELIGANLTRNQAKVAHAVCRKTYGFKKKMDRIADSQLAELCRISRPKASIAKNELIAMKVLVKDGSKIGPNKNISEWEIPECSQIDNIVTKSGIKNVTKLDTPSVIAKRLNFD